MIFKNSKRKTKAKNVLNKGSNILFTIGFSSFVFIGGFVYLFLLQQTKSMTKSKENNKVLIAQLKMKTDQLLEEYDFLNSNENILRLARKYYGKNVKQVPPKGVIYH
ncbi:MAG: hypothetical protein CMG00_06730 [Candidatus Marinimicrobia bacterium]|nr:hypothetical protein [Candidatus Neomarinimicrobiota bacterium]|tara:strand:- start:3841 stop:4161 length:321 start_codon:yes stop_codon:yes gene_type:complete